MSAVKAIRALLAADAGVTAIAGDKIYAGIIPQNTALPAIAINEISNVEATAVSLSEASSLVTSRVQVSVLETSYPRQKALLRAVRLAANHTSGTIAGVDVKSIIRDSVGPDQRNDDAGIYLQTIDFRVTYAEAN